MVMNNSIPVTISVDISFPIVPKGMEEYVSLIDSNATQTIESYLSELLSDNLEQLNETDIQIIAERKVQAECAFEAASAQSEDLQSMLAELSDGCAVSITISDNYESIQQKILEQVEPQIIEAIQAGIGG